MKWEELENNQELLDAMAAEIEKKVREGKSFSDARGEVLKAHDIEFDEDAMRAEAVDKMELDEESLNNVTGGAKQFFCWGDYSCYNILKHDDNDSKNHACFNNYYCIWMSRCDVGDVVPVYNSEWKKS